MSAFFKVPSKTVSHQRRLPVRQSILLVRGGGLQGGPADHSMASSNEPPLTEADHEPGENEEEGDGEEGNVNRFVSRKTGCAFCAPPMTVNGSQRPLSLLLFLCLTWSQYTTVMRV